MKRCITCKIELLEDNFYIDNKRKGGLHPVCKKCEHERAVKRYRENAEKEKARRKIYFSEHKKQILEKAKEYFKKVYSDPTRKETINKRNRENNRRNKDHIKIQTKEYRQRTKPKQTAKTRKYQAAVLQRLPKCADLSKMELFYEKARELTLQTGIKHEVDHIIPLRGKTVSGFHVEWNLQILTKSENSRKRNKF